MSSIMKGLNTEAIDSPDFKRQIKNITRMNPQGSAAEKMILNRFLSSPMYNTQLHGKDFVNTALEWLQRIKVDLTKKFPDADLSDLEDLAHKMYEDYLARIGQLEEANLPPRAAFNKKPKQKGPGYSKDDYEYTEFVPRDKKERGEEWAIKRDVMKQKLKKSEPKSMDTGFYKNYLGNRPVREGEVVSLAAKRSPLVIAGSPFDWNVYDLRTNQRVANILGGDRRERPMYEVRIKSSGMTSTKMPPTYVVTAGADNNPPYYAYELVAPEGGFGKIEKSPGPGGTTKLHPDKEDILRHMMKNLGGGKYYGYDLNMVEEGLNQWDLVEKALGAKIMEVDDAIELGYTDWDPNDSSSIIYLGNKKEKVDELRKETISNYLSQASAAVRGGKQERPKKVPSWKVAAGKLYPDKAMGKYAKIPASGIMQGVSETTSTGTSAGSAGIGGGSGIGVEASPIVKAFQNQVDEHINTPGGMGQAYRKVKVKGPAGIAEYKLPYKMGKLESDLQQIDNMVSRLPDGLDVSRVWYFAKDEFKRLNPKMNYAQQKEEFDKLKYGFYDVYKKTHKEKGLLDKAKDMIGLEENLLNTYGDQFGLDEDVYTDSLFKEFLDSEYNKDQGSYINTLRNLGQFIRSKDMPEDKAKPIIRKLIAKLHPSGLNEELMQLAELKCWAGYTRVRGVPAGAPGSCKKKTKESSIMKGIQNEYDVDSSRKIEFSKENPPSLDYLYQQFIHNMLASTNKIDPKDWIAAMNNRYGLGYTWKDYQMKGHQDHTNNWDKIINKYVLGKPA